MKKIINSIIIASALAVGSFAIAKEEEKKAPEVKLVCIDAMTKDGKPIIDPKTNKPKQDCKKMKVHKKLEGTPVPEKKK
jgi:hypothetical protein